MSKTDDMIEEMGAAFLTPVVDDFKAVGLLQALYRHLEESNVDLTDAQRNRLDQIQSEFRAGPGIFKGDLH
ncbi:hypothetical protein Q4610_18855 [Sphingobium sp. HBC34]|uniref:Uncharacterized protein n=1 Tax=Sphingobium cyanobacteriorum TaxID=3063954 RepID=A0ABT8ZRK0_9SPHN|nr:hypothetical protein [Sphingobium sp. HBC34]MDO7837108.1 hypothetical protein [Sphingobium sp. HBC34]